MSGEQTGHHRITTSNFAAFMPISEELLAEGVAFNKAWNRYWSASPEEREQLAREAAEQRRAEREAASPAPLTLGALLDKLGWSREYAEHVVQPYCTCGDSYDGWETCQHARDLGLTP